jgi:DNA end-binding protein Ku
VIGQLTHEDFDPSQYADEVKGRVRKLIAQKAKTGEITVPESAPEKPEVTDLMAALKASLGGGELPKAKGEPKRAAGTKRTHRAAPKRTAKAHAPRAKRSASSAHRSTRAASTRRKSAHG